MKKFVLVGIVFLGAAIVHAEDLGWGSGCPGIYEGEGQAVKADGTGYRYNITTKIEKNDLGIRITENLVSIGEKGKSISWSRETILKPIGNGFYKAVNEKGQIDEQVAAYCTPIQCHMDYDGLGPTELPDSTVPRHFEETWTFQEDGLLRVGSRRDATVWIVASSTQTLKR